ncbi:hypothetical protein ACHHYP_20715 [Achlya hypogyna]|uniref:Uncharacterized protein n=1 Tax=Achlya hypogyna TaxID=1202772 RepID=A0A1V9YDL6_ACHHY|nr:hypothetical protein ACHHYP_20715 [Achlya hypogyna]
MENLSYLVMSSIDLYCGKTDTIYDAFPNSRGAYTTYANKEGAMEIVAICSQSIMEATVSDINDAGGFAISSDESTDVSGSKNIVVVVRFVSTRSVQVRLLGVLELKAGTAAAIYDAIVDLLDKRGLDIGGLVSFASDGASRVPRLVSSHYSARRLSLAAENAEGEFETHYTKLLKDTYSFFRKLLPRLQALEVAIADYGTKQLKPQLGAFTRSLSRGESLASLNKLFPAIARVVANDTSGTAATLHEAFSDDAFHVWVAFMDDALRIVNNLSKFLQSKTMHIVSVAPVVTSTIHELLTTFPINSTLEGVSTPSLRKFLFAKAWLLTDDNAALTYSAGVQYVARLTVAAFTVLYPHELKKVGADENASIAQYGLEAIGILGGIYLPNISIVELEAKYNSYKYYALASLSRPSMEFLVEVITDDNHMKQSHPSIVYLIKVAATFLHGSVDCERAFSLQNNIKTDARSRLSGNHLQDLMVCAEDGPVSRFCLCSSAGEFKNAFSRADAHLETTPNGRLATKNR